MKQFNPNNFFTYAILHIVLFGLNAKAQNTYLDNTFNTSGYSIITNVPDHLDCQGTDMVLQADGKIIVVGGGTRVSQFRGDAIMVRLKTNGTPDSTFGTNGIVINEIGPLTAGHNCIEIQPDGKLLVSGVNIIDINLYTRQSYTARYNADGTFDTSFGVDGIMLFPGGASFTLQSVLQPDGRLLVAGWAHDQTTLEDQILIRYNSDGSLDESFDGNGYLVTDVNNSFERANDITLQPDGKIITGGYHVGASYYDFLITRYNSNGSIDSSFGVDGHVIRDLGGSTEICHSVLVQSDGKILAAGYTEGTTGQDFRFIIMRFNNDGSLDPSFNGSGIVDAGINDHGSVAPYGIALRPDGKIVFGGSAELNNSFTKKLTVLQLNPDGSRDAAFGTDGFVQVSISEFPDEERMMVLDENGKILLCGFTQYAGNSVIAFARILPELILGTLEFNNSDEVLIYPNPVQSSETLSYTLANDAMICISLFDIQGKHVKEILENQRLAAGQHSTTFSFPTELTAGVYFIKLISAKGIISVRVVKS